MSDQLKVHEAAAKFQQEIEESITDDDKAIIRHLKSLYDVMRGMNTTGGRSYSDYDENELSRFAGSIALLMPNLGDIVAKFNKQSKYYEGRIEFFKASHREEAAKKLQQTMGKKPTQADIQAYLRRQSFQFKLKHNLWEQKYEEAKHLWWSCRSLLNVIDTRISVLQGQRKATRYEDENPIDLMDQPQTKTKEFND